MTGPSRVTRLLGELADGDTSAAERLLPLVYDELRALAGRAFRGRQDHTLQPTALVHDVYMKLLGGDGEATPQWDGRRHFYVVAARAMRQMLVDYARMRRADKRGGQYERVSLAGDIARDAEEVELLELEAALAKLTELSPRQARIVELRYFTGRTIEETAEILGVSTGTVKSDWRTARAFLALEMERG